MISSMSFWCAACDKEYEGSPLNHSHTDTREPIQPDIEVLPLAEIEASEHALGNLLAIIFGDAGEKAASFPSLRDASEAAIQIFVDYRMQVEDPDILPYLRSRVDYWRTKANEKVTTITSLTEQVAGLKAELKAFSPLHRLAMEEGDYCTCNAFDENGEERCVGSCPYYLGLEAKRRAALGEGE